MDSCGEVVKSIFCENLCLLHLSLRGQAKYELTLLLHSCADGVFLVSSSAQTWKKKPNTSDLTIFIASFVEYTED